MKHSVKLFILSAFVFIFSSGFSQKQDPLPIKNGIYDQIDTRVDNMGYWMKMAEKGLTPYNPDIPLVPAVAKGSQIRSQGVRTTDSPDIPVTNLTNVTESENSVFIDPNNPDYVLNSNNSTSWSGSSVGSVYGANYFQSSNAGIGWAGSQYGAGGSNSGDPTTAIGLNGREYVNFISSASGQGIGYSDDGITWSSATVASNPGDMADKNHMWIDNKSTSPYEGNLYVAWTDFGGTDDTEIKIARSTNDGATWSTPVNLSSAINAGSHNQGVNIQTGPNGEVYAAWAVYDGWPTDETAIGFTKSVNGGVSYQTASRIKSNIRGIRTTTVSKNHRVNSFPAMAVDISGGVFNGNIYIVWTNIGTPGVNTGTNASVYIIRSSDGGSSWSTPVRVNQGPNVDGKKAYFPWISCDPVTGVLSVIFYDDRNVASTQNEVFVAYSMDAGNNWTDFQVSDVAFTPAAISGLASGYMGDYLGITSLAGKVYPCWTDNRNGLYMTYVSPFEYGLDANFIAASTTVCTGSGVTFTDVSTGPPTFWTWSFPGGTPSAYVGKYPPAIVYASSGTYDVTLTVADGSGTNTETKTAFITVKDLIAGFTGNPTTVVVGNNVTFTDNSTCGPAYWEWSFPGGNPSSFIGQTPPPINYSVLGNYDVSLTVTKPGGTDTKTKTGYITVTPPVFNITNGTITTCTGDFYDSGGPTGDYQNSESFTETFYPATPGFMMRFIFASFNTESGFDYLKIYDGESTSAPLIGSFNGTVGPGTITATNPGGALTFNFTSDGSVVRAGWAATITCFDPYLPPVADFTASDSVICPGAGITFTDETTGGPPTSWHWEFPGGTPSAHVGQTPPPIVYTSAGTYDVSLVVADALNSDTVVKTGFVNVKDVIAGFTGTPTTIVVGNNVTFADNSTCGPETWEWSFPGGDPVAFTGQNPPPVNYSTTGTYNVSLTVTKAGNPDTKIKTGYITVVPASFNITNGTVTTCSGLFYDSGGPAGNYQNNESFTETFYPATSGNKMRFNFTSFNTESGWDFLKIYDGENTSAPLIGSYSGTVGPGTVTATNPSGALTFRFTSDGSYVREGWAANIGCYNPNSPPVADFSAMPTFALIGQTVSFTDLSANNPTAWLWNIAPGTFAFVGGTTAASTNPQVQFSALGQYSVTLTASNAFGTGTKIKTNYISVTNCNIESFPWAEGFENAGIIPNCWTQEQVNSSGLNWTFTTGNGGLNPPAAHNGVYNACLKDNTSADNKTRLITPSLNISALWNPQLKFWHTQTYWSPDQDMLTVYYKTSASGTWIQLASYASNIASWTQETLSLPGASETYYIAFEGNAKYGYGVCIDDVEVLDNCPSTYPVSISIEASANPVEAGTFVTFTAASMNGGTSPVYQWFVNGSVAGTNESSYTYMPGNNDAVMCTLTSNLACVTGNPANSNLITMVVDSVPVNRELTNITVTGTECFDALQTITVAGNDSTFTVPAGGATTLIAGLKILFYPGTTVHPGGYLYGYIAPTGPFCTIPTKAALSTGKKSQPVMPEKNFFRLFPNPTNGDFTVALKGYVPSERTGVEIYNTKGEKIFSAEMNNTLKQGFTLTGNPAGLYLVRVISGNLSGVERIIKQ